MKVAPKSARGRPTGAKKVVKVIRNEVSIQKNREVVLPLPLAFLPYFN